MLCRLYSAIALLALLHAVAAESLRGSSRALLDENREERKEAKREHWKLTQGMDYASKVRDAFNRKSAYKRRNAEYQERLDEYKVGEMHLVSSLFDFSPMKYMI